MDPSESSGSTAAEDSRNLSEVAAPPPLEHQPEHRAPDQTHNQFLAQQAEKPRELGPAESTVPQPVTAEDLQHHHHPWTEATDRGYDEGYGHENAPGPGVEHLSGPAHEKPPESKPTDVPVPLSKRATHLYTVSYLVFFSVWGTLARLGMQSLTFYTGAPVVTSVLWANVAGCIVMGFFLEDKNLFKEEWGDAKHRPPPSDEQEEKERIKAHKSVKKTIPLYIGLTTGFCGCFTSFSSFLRDVFLALSNDLPNPTRATIYHRNGGYSFMAIIGVIIIEVSLSLSALIFGAHLALALAPVTPTVPFNFTRKFVDRICVVLGWGCWLGAVFLAIWPPDRHQTTETWRGRAIFAVVFSPLGCLFRFYISLYLNPRLPTFPLGTFAANMLGTIILGMCYDLQHAKGIGAVATGGLITKSLLTSCQVLQGVMDGFCGSATTVSTWVSELNGLSCRRSAYLYGILSVGVGLGFLVVIMGSLRWTLGFVHPAC
ncbi:hypothetical protein MPDQ_005795 [Monascus purpureus]|uniref:Chromosome condensation protein n=1 Tax=Monascus purpureus TaxID=5098 RepID=A0A507QZE2_MONPU|nr:hypothetical protein MPDQ_005795 [Monascus purpureus]BDD55226.1 hypothetical protein MAP00_000771 [Monascus purpureus]